MNKQLSTYLDVIRFLAAFFVFASHANVFSGGIGWQLSFLGHEAVVIFFVLSGFIIHYVVTQKAEVGARYFVKRATRIYSVVIPALFITVISYLLVTHYGTPDFGNKTIKPMFQTLFAALTFTNQSWSATTVFTNMPYWSIGYEVLFYIFFGTLLFAKKVWRSLLLLIIIGLMGFSITLYLPIWLFGAYCHKHVNRLNEHTLIAWIGLIVTSIGFAFFSLDSVQNAIDTWANSQLPNILKSLILEPADHFGSDYLLAICFGFHIISVKAITQNITFPTLKIITLTKRLSVHTFALYLLHMPLLFVVRTFLPYEQYSWFNVFTVWLIIPLIIIGISHYIEKYKRGYQRFFSALFTPKCKSA